MQILIKPAIDPGERHKIEDFLLSGCGLDVDGGGTWIDGSQSEISFDGFIEKTSLLEKLKNSYPQFEFELIP